MKLKKSILGGGIAQDLLKDLDGKPLHHVARFNSNGADLSFALRRSYRTGSSKWTGTTLLVKHEATGGMFLTAHGYAGYSWAQTYSKTYRLAPAQVARARGVKKHFSPEEIAKRTARLLANRHTPSRRRPAV
jgi:hypothetical protein